MHKYLYVFILMTVLASVSFAEKMTYIEKQLIHVGREGKIKREAPFRSFTFDVEEKQIYVSGKITKTNAGNTKGETFEWSLPYTIFSREQTLPVYFSSWEQLFYSALGKENSTIKKEPEQVINAIGQAILFANHVPVMLQVGESFYMMTRPLSGNDALVVSIGERAD